MLLAQKKIEKFRYQFYSSRSIHQGFSPSLSSSHSPRRPFSPVRKKSTGIKFTEEEFQTAFQIFDKDGDGSISREEIETVLESLGQHVTAEELDKIFGEVGLELRRMAKDVPLLFCCV